MTPYAHSISTDTLARLAPFAAGLALAAAATGCGAPPKPGNFPTKAELDQIAAAPIPNRTFEKGTVDVEQWELLGPLPEAYDASAAPSDSAWGKLLDDGIVAMGKPGLVLTSAAMECLARQVAAFAIAKNAPPAAPLRAFMAARCGVPASSVSTDYMVTDVPEGTTEADILAKWKADITAEVPKAVGSGPRFAGIAFVLKDKRAAAAIVSSPRGTKLQTVPMVPVDGKVVLKGELLDPAESVRALVTRGKFGYETCIRDVDIELPKFTIECPVAADDASARVELAAFQAGRELGSTVVDVRVYPAGKPDTMYSHAAPKNEPFPADAAGLSTALLASINGARKAAGMSEVRAASVQGATATRLAPYYFAGMNGGLDFAVADKVALGMLAGWEVDGMVREGHFSSEWGYERDVAAFVELAIASPFGRETLLDPGIAQIAVGPYLHDGVTGFGAMFGTYALLDTTGKTDNAAAVLARLTKLRAKIKRPAPDAATEVEAAVEDVVAKVQGGLSLDDALKRLTERSVDSISRGSVRSWCVVSSSVEKLEFPSDLLATPDVRLGVGVARYKPEGSPWTKLAVFFVMLKEPAPTNVAKAPGPNKG